MEEAVVEALVYGDREAKVQAARALSNLRTTKQRHKLGEREVIAPLVSMLRTPDYEGIQAALFALLSLAFGTERNKMRIVKAGAVPALLNLLQCQSWALVDPAIAALLILSSCTPNKLPIAASGAVQLLLETLNGGHGGSLSKQAKLDIVATLHNLSTCPQAIPSIASSAVVLSLLHLIHGSEKTSEVVEKAMALLENIVSSSEIALRETANASGAIGALVEAVEEGSPLCREHAVGVLLLICQSCREQYRGLILKEGAMPGLLELSVEGTWRAKQMAESLLLLLRGCRREQSKNVFLEQAMEQIDAEERVGTELTLVEEMIAKLRA